MAFKPGKKMQKPEKLANPAFRAGILNSFDGKFSTKRVKIIAAQRGISENELFALLKNRGIVFRKK